jgi:hypothetical protein
VKVRPDPQHVSLAAFFAELAQLTAGAVDLVAAQEVEPGAVSQRLGADINGQLPLGAEHQILWQAHGQRLHRVADVLGGDPLPGADQRVPGPLTHMIVRRLRLHPRILPFAAGHRPNGCCPTSRRSARISDSASLLWKCVQIGSLCSRALTRPAR